MAIFKLEINVAVPKFDHIVIVYKISKHLSIKFWNLYIDYLKNN